MISTETHRPDEHPPPGVPTEDAPDRPWASEAGVVARRLGADLGAGLDEPEVAARRARYGPNRLQAVPTRSPWRILLDQLRSLVVALLAVAAAVAFAFGDVLEGWAVLVVILLNTAIGFTTEWRAVRAMEALYVLGSVTTRVRRGGRLQRIAAEELVPGDVVLVEGGDVVTADLRLRSASKLLADESALTGESEPVVKRPDPVPADTPLAERAGMLYKGTAVTRGAGEGVVVGTGMATELGAISALVAASDEAATPLEQRLDRLARRLIGVALVVTALVAVLGTTTGKDLVLMVETGLALAVAAIPEGLPVVATIALARGLRRMARRHALVNRLASVETLGATGVICTDKTGTLTENRMTVSRLVVGSGEVVVPAADGDAFERDGAPLAPEEDPLVRAALEVGVLCSSAALDADGEGGTGDPLELALLAAARRAGLRRDALTAERPEARQDAFDAEVKMMATFHQVDGAWQVAVKGAPENVLAASTSVLQPSGPAPLSAEGRADWMARNEALAADGVRVLAVAGKTVDALDAPPYDALTFVGLVGLLDPPRAGVREAVEACRRAGIEVVMVTGDQPVTARGIARAVGLVDDHDAEVVHGADLQPYDAWSEAERAALRDVRIFARVTPRQKLDLIALHQEAGRIVAMTGDGVNDAPALKKADIGVAMGRRGTQVAREAADMVLQDDAFSTIVAAVEEGRAIFENIRKFVRYLLSCNVSEVMVVGLAAVAGATLPVRPLQILFLNLVTDVFPALALGLGAGTPHLMRRPPRDPAEPIVTRRDWAAIALYGLVFTAAVLGTLGLAEAVLALPPADAVTLSFLTLAFAQLWHVFNMREHGHHALRNEVTANGYVWGALGLCVALILAAVYLPPVASVLQVRPPSAAGWSLVGVMSLVPLLLGPVVHRATRSVGTVRRPTTARSSTGVRPAPARHDASDERRSAS